MAQKQLYYGLTPNKIITGLMVTVPTFVGAIYGVSKYLKCSSATIGLGTGLMVAGTTGVVMGAQLIISGIVAAMVSHRPSALRDPCQRRAH